MDKINELMAWITLAVGWWLYKCECITIDKVESGKVAAVVCIGSDKPRPLTDSQFHSEQLHGESIISSGLSDLMRKKPRLNKGRRVEDRQAADQ